jgi:hypothetical protein
MRYSLGEIRKSICLALLLSICLTVSLSAADSAFPTNWESALQADGTINDLSILPDNDTVGQTTSVVVSFALADDSISGGTEFQLVVPPEYGFSEVDSVVYSDIDAFNTDFGVDHFEFSDGIMRVELDTLGSAAAIGIQTQLTIYGVSNPQEVGSYRFALALLTSEGDWLAPPVWSPYFDLIAGPLAQLELFPKGVQSVQAGTTIRFYIQTTDQYGNDVSVSLVDWQVLGAPVVTGTIVDGNFQARKTGASRISAAAGGLADTSSLIYVLPGAFAYLSMDGGSAKAYAGHAWPDDTADVTVVAHDIFGNVIQEFVGDVYFQCTDPSALIPATEASPFHFTADDAGRHTFPGSSFTFFIAGKQDLRLLYDSEVQQTLSSITVLPDLATHFDMTVPETAVAGESFSVEVAAATDNWGNTIDGVVQIEIISDNGTSPSGAEPAITPFVVTDGAGSTNLTLVNAVTSELLFTLDTLTYSAGVSVDPADPDRFDFSLATLQVVGQPFFAPATLTAIDPFGNIATAFSAANDRVTITSSGQGTVFKNLINGDGDFVNGVCDLTDIGTGYTGSEFFVTFTATSFSGKSGTSPVVQFAAVKITDGHLQSSTKYIGETYDLLVTITNFGAQPTSVNDLRIYGNGEPVQPTSVVPTLPDTITGASHQTYTISGPVPDLPGGTIVFSLGFSGAFGNDAITDSLDSFATLNILSPTGIGVLPESFTPTQVTADREYAYSVYVRNDAEDDLTLQTGTELLIASGGETVLDLPLQSVTLVESNGGTVKLEFGDAAVPSEFAGTLDDISLHLVGTLGSISYDSEFPVENEILVQSPPHVSYLLSTLAPTTVYRGRDVQFSLSVENTGTAVMAITSGDLSLYAADRLLVTRLTNDIQQIVSGENPLTFNSTFLPTDWPLEFDSLTLNITGTANSHDEEVHLKLPGNLLTIPSGAAVRIMSMTDGAPNAPWVNVGQEFPLSVIVQNEGDEPLQDIALRLTSNGSSNFDDSVEIATVALDADTTIVFDIEASLTANISELFAANIVSAKGANSGLPAQILPPNNNSQVVVIQTPAALSLSTDITSPPEAQDRIVEPETEFTISAVVVNAGQANVGSGMLVLELPDDAFTTSDPLRHSFSVGEQVSWLIQAPNHPDTGMFHVFLDSLPDDLNWNRAAKVIDSQQFLDIAVREVQVEISVDFEASDSPLMAAGGSYSVLDLSFNVLGKAEKPYLSYIDIFLRNRAGESIDPDRLLSAASVLYNGQDEVNGAFMSDPPRVRFPLGSSYDLPRSAELTLGVRQDPLESDFTLYLDSTSFAAAYQSAGGEKQVPVKADFASLLVIKRDFTLVSHILSEAFFCYPNPFSPNREQLQFSRPSPDKPAVLTIFTLTGEQVVSLNVPADGNDSFSWDGRTASGGVVLNGVYIAVLTVEAEGEVRTKVAVVK